VNVALLFYKMDNYNLSPCD